ncbi:MAG: hypothetical protein A4E19_18615 [Nitrospira sp. SG-bin1]|nr:MAG: hypothetical protein A4E19_18615 [Nitrospira sp. SG-bin1]
MKEAEVEQDSTRADAGEIDGMLAKQQDTAAGIHRIPAATSGSTAEYPALAAVTLMTSCSIEEDLPEPRRANGK